MLQMAKVSKSNEDLDDGKCPKLQTVQQAKSILD